MSVKNKKKNSALEPKNLIIMAIAATVVVFVAITMRLIVPSESVEQRESFDSAAWQSAVDEASERLSKEAESEVDVGLIEVDGSGAIPTTANAVPTETAEETPEDSNSQNRDPSTVSYALPIVGAVTADYSGEELVYSKTMRDWRTHNGIDFAAEEGADVLAAADGTVEAVAESGMMGRTVVILHSGGVRTIYSNLADVEIVNVGDSVMQGAVIGKAGSSAAAEISEPPHIHFEMSVNEVPVNPHDYINIG